MTKTIEETYKKLTPIEHVLERPNMYIGDVRSHSEEMWVWSGEKMEYRVVDYTPGLLKIFDEVLTNAMDHSARDETVTKIKVVFDSDTISVTNNGTGIPIVMHKEHNVYVPELIFGHMLTSSNYDDKDKRTGAGTNGLGIKVCSIMSRKLIVETVDSDTKQKYIQHFSRNMSVKSKPKPTKFSGASYTKITFVPEYERFSMTGMTPDMLSLLHKRVYDCVACTHPSVTVSLNGATLKGKGLVDYTKFFFDDPAKVIHEIHDAGNSLVWEYAVVPSDTFQCISFVNGNCTYQGGKHVDYILYQITSKLKALIESKKKIKDVRPAAIKDRLFLFLRATVINPHFSSQSKELLTTQSKEFGCKIDVSDAFIAKLYKSDIVNEIVELHDLRAQTELKKKTDGSKKTRVVIPNLEDAAFAGTSKSNQCTLILTEGLSAKTFAMWGRTDSDRFGIYALKGKCLNVRDASAKQILENQEINSLKQILGLKQGNKYKNTNDLRYGKVLVLTDADSVTFDTPCLVKNKKTDMIEYRPICEINDNVWVKPNKLCDKEYSTCSNYLSWTDSGWTDIKSVMRHRVTKPIHRVLTHTGCVDVTEDHSLLSKNLEEITVKDIVVKQTELCHKKYIQEKVLCSSVSEELAWAMGYFQADGSVQIDGKCKNRPRKRDGVRTESVNSHWNITCADLEPLEKLQKIFQKYEFNEVVDKPDVLADKQCGAKLRFCIKKLKVSRNSFSEKSGREFRYILEARGSIRRFCVKYRRMFYNSLREKIVPVEILNSTTTVQNAFIDGFYEGDGCKTPGTMKFDGEYKSQISGLFYLVQNCGYTPSLNFNNSKPNVYSVSMGYATNRPIDTVKKIMDVSEKYKDTYVYDFETESHHFQGGIGNIIVKNCDGIHIRTLVINIFHHWWRELLDFDFLQTLRTPIVKVVANRKTIEFFTQQDYKTWAATHSASSTKYFKGLGTSQKADAKDIFGRFDKLKIDYVWKDKGCDEAITLAFGKDKGKVIEKMSDKRKAWLCKYDKNVYIDAKETRVSFADLIHKELVHFSISDNIRSIPCVCDGLKPSQRKILYYMLKNNITSDSKVAQLSGYVSAETSYHHGEMSLQQAIITMAQDFIGKNNINLLLPKGNFGSRYLGGKDAASPRYIFTCLNPLTLDLFPKADFDVLDYIVDEGLQVEPEYYSPIVPMVLVNGCEGIGTGYSTSVPPHNPKDIVQYLLDKLDGKTTKTLVPYHNGFRGTIETLTDSYTTTGVWTRKSGTVIEITEIPVNMWVSVYKEFLEGLIEDKTSMLMVKDVVNHTTDENSDVRFTVEFRTKAALDELIESKTIIKELKLSRTFSTSNMHLFTVNSTPKRYGTTDEIIDDFYTIRLEMYEKRRQHQIGLVQKELPFLYAKIRFITEYIDGILLLNRQTRESIHAQLVVKEYPKQDNTYNYLVNLPMISLTMEKIRDLQDVHDAKVTLLKTLQESTPKGMWKLELEVIQSKLNC